MSFKNCKLELTGDAVLCELLPVEEKSKEFVFEEPYENYVKYKIVDMYFTSEQNKNSFKFEIGDTVVASTNPGPMEIDGKKYCLFHPISITAKIIEKDK